MFCLKYIIEKKYCNSIHQSQRNLYRASKKSRVIDSAHMEIANPLSILDIIILSHSYFYPPSSPVNLIGCS